MISPAVVAVRMIFPVRGDLVATAKPAEVGGIFRHHEPAAASSALVFHGEKSLVHLKPPLFQKQMILSIAGSIKNVPILCKNHGIPVDPSTQTGVTWNCEYIILYSRK
jgi:hypothetical protein